MTHQNGDPCPSCNLDWVYTLCPECGWRKGKGGSLSEAGAEIRQQSNAAGGTLDSGKASQGGLGNCAIRGVGEGEGGSLGCVDLVLPWDVLVSSNKRSGGMVGWTTKEYREKRDAATTLVRFAHKGPPIERPVKVSVTFYPPDRRVRDSTNLMKAIVDALVAGGLLADDNDTVVRAWEGYVEQPTADARAEISVQVLDLETGEAA